MRFIKVLFVNKENNKSDKINLLDVQLKIYQLKKLFDYIFCY